MSIDKDPRRQIAAGNAWYTDDQFAGQLGSSGRRAMIENRWRIFQDAVARWRDGRPASSGGPLAFLDAGCGDGINLYGFSRIFAALGLDATLTGVDYNAVRIERAQHLDGVKTVMEASLTALPFADDAFDVVLCNHVLEHIPDTTKALSELRRILKEDGLLILGVPNEGCWIAQVRNRLVQPEIGATTDHIHFFTSATLRAAMAAAGFAVVNMEREGFFLPHLTLNNIAVERSWGRAALGVLRTVLPSQAAGLIAIAKPAAARRT